MKLFSCVKAVVLASALGCSSAQRTERLDPVRLAPECYTVLLVNDDVRVLEFNLKAGATEGLHTHPAYLVYALSAFRLRFSTLDGKSIEREATPGEVFWSDGACHAVENVGESDARALLVELR